MWSISFVGLILLLLGGCILLLVVAGLGKLFFSAIGSRQSQPTAPGQPAERSGLGGALAAFFGVVALLAVFAIPILFVARTRMEHASGVRMRQAPAFDARDFAEVQQLSARPSPSTESHSVSSVSSETSSRKGLLNLVKTKLAELEENEDPSPTIRRMRDLYRQVIRTQDKKDTTAPSEDEDQALQLAEAPMERPEWTRSESGGDIHVVVSEPRASEEAARKQAIKRASDLIMIGYREHNAGVQPWHVDPEEVYAVRRQYTEQIPWDFTAGTDFDSEEMLEGTAYRTYLQISTAPEVHAAVYQQWKSSASHRRLEAVGAASGCMVAAVALLAVFFRIEKRGFWRRGMRVASLLGAGGLAMGSLAVGADGLSEPTHVGPAREHVHRQPSFAGTAISGHRIGFVVVGDEQLREGDKIEHIAREIANCIKQFDSVEYRIYCESSEQPLLQTSGQFTGGDGPGLEFLQRTIASAFPEGSDTVLPHRTVKTLFRDYRPDQVVVISNDSDEQNRNRAALREILSQGRPVHFFDVKDGKVKPATSGSVTFHHHN